MINSNAMQRLGLITLMGMGFLAVIIDFFSDRVDLASALIGNYLLPWQLIIGCATGLVAGKISVLIVSAKFMTPVREKYARLFAGLELSTSQIWFVSYCAGFGEEILFRGALQPFFGIQFTSILFVAVHGYLDPRNWRLMIYGVWMTGVIVWIGWMSEHFGLVSAIVAHMIIDVVIFFGDSSEEA